MNVQKVKADFNTIVVELKPGYGGEEDVALSFEDMVEKSRVALDNAMGTIRSMSQKVVKSVRSIPIVDRPSTIEVEFGLKLSSDSSAVVVAAGVEAQLNIKLVWDRTKAQNKKKQ
jgi:hypothetical protein